MRQAHDINTPMNIHETIETASNIAATAVATTKTKTTPPSASAGNDDGQRTPGERQQSM
jgi:hypothetical protein